MGLMWNEYLNATKKDGKPSTSFIMENTSSGQSFWIGQKYLLWESNTSNCATWLYAHNNRFFLEITPEYPWHFVDPTESETFYSYDEFIKNYKPLAIIEIHKNHLEEWLLITKHLIETMKTNQKKLHGPQ